MSNAVRMKVTDVSIRFVGTRVHLRGLRIRGLVTNREP